MLALVLMTNRTYRDVLAVNFGDLLLGEIDAWTLRRVLPNSGHLLCSRIEVEEF